MRGRRILADEGQCVFKKDFVPNLVEAPFLEFSGDVPFGEVLNINDRASLIFFEDIMNDRSTDQEQPVKETAAPKGRMFFVGLQEDFVKYVADDLTIPSLHFDKAVNVRSIVVKRLEEIFAVTEGVEVSLRSIHSPNTFPKANQTKAGNPRPTAVRRTQERTRRRG